MDVSDWIDKSDASTTMLVSRYKHHRNGFFMTTYKPGLRIQFDAIRQRVPALFRPHHSFDKSKELRASWAKEVQEAAEVDATSKIQGRAKIKQHVRRLTSENERRCDEVVAVFGWSIS